MNRQEEPVRKILKLRKPMDRKEMVRKYKETRPQMGVYRVWNKSNGKSLVGAYANLPAILNRHRFQLEAGLHPNRALQSDWNDLGPSSFEFEILDTLKPLEPPDRDPQNDLAVLEQLWLDKIEPYGDRGYNAKPRQE
jgi:hypothetical protein